MLLKLLNFYRSRRDPRFGLTLDRRRWDRKSGLIIAGLLALGAAFLAGLWWVVSADSRALAETGITTSGQVQELIEETSNGKTRYIVEVGFADAAGAAHEVRLAVSKATFATLAPGGSLPVTYAPADPEGAVEVERGSRAAEARVLAIVAGVLGALALIFAILALMARPDQPAARRPQG
jgi:hypothetical protein